MSSVKIGSVIAYEFSCTNQLGVKFDPDVVQVSIVKDHSLEDPSASLYEDLLTYLGGEPRDSQLTKTAVGEYRFSYVTDRIGVWAILPRWSDPDLPAGGMITARAPVLVEVVATEHQFADREAMIPPGGGEPVSVPYATANTGGMLTNVMAVKFAGIPADAQSAAQVTATVGSSISTIPTATASRNGLATSVQITKLDGLPSDAQSASQVATAAGNAVAGIPDATALVRGLATADQVNRLSTVRCYPFYAVGPGDWARLQTLCDSLTPSDTIRLMPGTFTADSSLLIGKNTPSIVASKDVTIVADREYVTHPHPNSALIFANYQMSSNALVKVYAGTGSRVLTVSSVTSPVIEVGSLVLPGTNGGSLSVLYRVLKITPNGELFDLTLDRPIADRFVVDDPVCVSLNTPEHWVFYGGGCLITGAAFRAFSLSRCWCCSVGKIRFDNTSQGLGQGVVYDNCGYGNVIHDVTCISDYGLDIAAFETGDQCIAYNCIGARCVIGGSGADITFQNCHVQEIWFNAEQCHSTIRPKAIDCTARQVLNRAGLAGETIDSPLVERCTLTGLPSGNSDNRNFNVRFDVGIVGKPVVRDSTFVLANDYAGAFFSGSIQNADVLIENCRFKLANESAYSASNYTKYPIAIFALQANNRWIMKSCTLNQVALASTVAQTIDFIDSSCDIRQIDAEDVPALFMNGTGVFRSKNSSILSDIRAVISNYTTPGPVFHFENTVISGVIRSAFGAGICVRNWGGTTFSTQLESGTVQQSSGTVVLAGATSYSIPFFDLSASDGFQFGIASESGTKGAISSVCVNGTGATITCTAADRATLWWRIGPGLPRSMLIGAAR